MIDASSCFASIIVSDSVGIRFVTQERQLKNLFYVIFGPVLQVIPIQHIFIKICHVSRFNNALDSPNGIEIIRLFCFIKVKN